MQEIERFRAPTRWFHWIHSAVFLVLFVTGVFLWVEALGFLAIGGWSRLVHRLGAVLFVVVPLVYLASNWKSSLESLKEVFTWGRDDLEWFKAAPTYYFLGDESQMPPQGEFNTGQKMFYLTAILGGLVLGLTGVLMWLPKGWLPAVVFQWSVFFHDAAVIFVVSFFLVHLYLSAFHPKMTESLRSMWTGKVSGRYAESHYKNWYDRNIPPATAGGSPPPEV